MLRKFGLTQAIDILHRIKKDDKHLVRRKKHHKEQVWEQAVKQQLDQLSRKEEQPQDELPRNPPAPLRFQISEWAREDQRQA